MSRPLSYYSGLISRQYQNSPKFLAWVAAQLQPLVDAAALIDVLDDAFTLDLSSSPITDNWALQANVPIATEGGLGITTESGLQITTDPFTGAVGPQLDIIGARVGASRTVPFQPSNGVSPILDDDTYRLLIKATVGRNQWDGTRAGIQALWGRLFPGGRIVMHDNLDMSLTVTLSGTFTSIIQDMIVHDMIIPRAETVRINVLTGPAPYFGFDAQDQYISGFDSGFWS